MLFSLSLSKQEVDWGSLVCQPCHRINATASFKVKMQKWLGAAIPVDDVPFRFKYLIHISLGPLITNEPDSIS